MLSLLVALSTPPVASAEESPEPAPVQATSAAQLTHRTRHSVALHYFAHNFTHPGFILGYTFRAVSSARDRHALVVGVDLGSYFWARHDYAVFVTPRVGWRGRGRRGLTGTADFNLGYMHSFVPGDVYEVVDGEVRETTASLPFLWFGGTVGIGWTFLDVGKRVDLTPLIRAGAYGQHPLWDELLVRLVLTAGMEVRF